MNSIVSYFRKERYEGLFAADQDGLDLKNTLMKELADTNYTLVDLSVEPHADFVDAACAISQKLLEDEESLGFIIDRYGAGSYMAACKIKGIIACECSDERSAYMTREHNNARLICMGSGIVGPDLARNIVKQFLNSKYAAGRHQIRVDMLNTLC